MSYLHIDNLYKAQEILAFRQCYALEKIHGTSAHVAWQADKLSFFSGGVPQQQFVELFDAEGLVAKFAERFAKTDRATVFGEAYGGKCQGMSKTYGASLKFVAFEVRLGDVWLAVPQAAECALHLGLEFVDYAFILADIDLIDVERDRPSTQAVRNGITEPRIREGVVLRPPFEVRLNNGGRVIAKHKRAEFSERGRSTVEFDPTKREKLLGADTIALEWVTPMRLEHVIDTVVSARDNKQVNLCDIPTVIGAMLEDITRESAGEVEIGKPVRTAIGSRTAKLFKQRLVEDVPKP